MSKKKLGFSTGKGFLEKVDKAANATYTDFTNGLNYTSQTTDEDGEYVTLPTSSEAYLIKATHNGDDIQFLIYDINNGASHTYPAITKCYMDADNGFTIHYYFATIGDNRKLRVCYKEFRFINGVLKDTGATYELSFKAQRIR